MPLFNAMDGPTGGNTRVARWNALGKGGGVTALQILQAKGVPFFLHDFLRTELTFQDSGGLTAADDAAEPAALALGLDAFDGRGVVNVLRNSQELDASTWTKQPNAIVTANQALAPDGTMTADLVTTSAATSGAVLQTTAFPSGAAGCGSIFLKKGNTDWVRIQITDGSSHAFWFFYNLATGAKGVSSGSVGSPTIGTPVISNEGDGWYRISLPGSLPSSTSGIFFFPAASDGGGGVIGATVYAWGAELVRGSAASEYQPTGSVVGGPGNHAVQTVSTSYRPTRQADGSLKGDGLDDNLLSALTSSASMFMAVALLGSAAPAATAALIGGPVSTVRGYLSRDTSGRLSAGVGANGPSIIFGGSNISGLKGVAMLNIDAGGNVDLEWMPKGGSLTSLYSQPINGAVAAGTALRLWATNPSGTAANFSADSLYLAAASQAAFTAAERRTIATEWNGRIPS